MRLLSSLLFAVSSSLDALLVSMTWGLRRHRISFLHNLIISLITLAGTVLAFWLGGSIIPLLAAFPSVANMIDQSGSVLLMVMGIYYLVKFVRATCSSADEANMQLHDDVEPCPESDPQSVEDAEAPAGALSRTMEDAEAPAGALSRTMEDAGAPTGALSQYKADAEAPTGTLSRELILTGIALSANNLGIGLGASLAGLILLPSALLTFLCSVCFLYAGNRLGEKILLQPADKYTNLLSGLLLIILGLCQLL